MKGMCCFRKGVQGHVQLTVISTLHTSPGTLDCSVQPALPEALSVCGLRASFYLFMEQAMLGEHPAAKVKWKLKDS